MFSVATHHYPGKVIIVMETIRQLLYLTLDKMAQQTT